MKLPVYSPAMIGEWIKKEHDQLAAQAQVMREALLRLEYNQALDEVNWCSECDYKQGDGHSPNCDKGNALSLTPLAALAAVEARAGAKALRDAAEQIDGRTVASQAYAQWLRDRAATLESTAQARAKEGQ